MKVYFGFHDSCALNYQHLLIYSELSKFFEITEKVEEADILVVAESCSCSEFRINRTLQQIQYLYDHKKEKAKIYLTGCITREFKNPKLSDSIQKWLCKHVDYIIPQNQPNLLLKMISEEYFFNVDIHEFGMEEAVIEEYPDFMYREATLYLSNGCMNNCFFLQIDISKLSS